MAELNSETQLQNNETEEQLLQRHKHELKQLRGMQLANYVSVNYELEPCFLLLCVMHMYECRSNSSTKEEHTQRRQEKEKGGK